MITGTALPLALLKWLGYGDSRKFNEELLGDGWMDFAARFNQEEIDKACERFANAAQQLHNNRDELLRLVSFIDLTTLSGDDTPARVSALVDRAFAPFKQETMDKLDVSDVSQIRCAAVCTYPARVADVVKRIGEVGNGRSLLVASTAGGFPSGQYHLESRLMEIKLAVRDGATEIDTVINRAAALTGDWRTVYEEVRAMKDACGSMAHLKTILATGELKTYENIYKASMCAMMAGSDTIKTSTGKEAVNATLPVAYCMCTAIADYYAKMQRKVGFKAAGGVRTSLEAFGYQTLVGEMLGADWLLPSLFRIGASSLIDDVEDRLVVSVSPEPVDWASVPDDQS